MQVDTVRVLEAGEDALAADIACALTNIRAMFAQAQARVNSYVFTAGLAHESHE